MEVVLLIEIAFIHVFSICCFPGKLSMSSEATAVLSLEGIVIASFHAVSMEGIILETAFVL